MNYDELLQLKAAKSAKKGGKETLAELDGWRIQLSREVRKDPRPITHEELAKLMQWKLKRGTFRPKLQQLAESNSSVEVKETTKKAVDLINKGEIIDSIKELCNLKGVGPATASLLGSVISEEVPFFSDEAFDHVCPGVKITYTLKTYQNFFDAIRTWGEDRNLSPAEAEKEAWILGMRKKHNQTKEKQTKPDREQTEVGIKKETKGNVKDELADGVDAVRPAKRRRV